MNKKNIILAAALGVLAVALLAVYLIVSRKPAKQEENNTNYFAIRKIDTEQVDRLTLKTEQFEGLFLLKGDQWIYEEEDIFPVKQASVNMILSVIVSNLNAFEKLNNPSDIADYGLADPTAVLKVYSGDTCLLELRVGIRVPTQNRYYAMVDGDDSVYVVSDNYYTYLAKSRTDFLESVQLPTIEEWTLLREITITEGENVIFHAIHDENNPYDYSGVNLFNWYIKEPLNGFCNADLNGDAWYEMLQRYLHVTYDKPVAYRPANLATYGLNNPHTSISVRYADRYGREDYVYTVDFGNETEDGGVYMKLRELDWVFLMNADVAAAWKDINVFNVCHKTVFFPSGKTFKKITVTAGTDRWEFVNTDTNLETPVYALNGKTLTTDAFTGWSQKVLLLKYSERVTSDEHGAEVMTIETDVADPDVRKNMKIVFYEYSDSVYLVSVNGAVDFAIDVRKVNDFIEYMKSFAAEN